jgi:plasmid stabilization system protein ParE
VKVRWSAHASRDLLEVLDFLARESPPAAEKFLRRLEAGLRRVASFPDSGRPVLELLPEDESQREVIVNPYRVGYAIRSKGVVVLYVVHQARRFPPER